MGKPVLGIVGANPIHGRTEGFVQGIACAGLGSAQPGFEFAPAVFDGAEIGRLRGQKQHPCPAGLDAFAHAGHFVDAHVVEHDHVAGLQSGAEHLVEVSGKVV